MPLRVMIVVKACPKCGVIDLFGWECDNDGETGPHPGKRPKLIDQRFVDMDHLADTAHSRDVRTHTKTGTVILQELLRDALNV